jgi:hypothetical protein
LVSAERMETLLSFRPTTTPMIPPLVLTRSPIFNCFRSASCSRAFFLLRPYQNHIHDKEQNTKGTNCIQTGPCCPCCPVPVAVWAASTHVMLSIKVIKIVANEPDTLLRATHLARETCNQLGVSPNY